MPIRKPTKSFEEVRRSALAHKTHLAPPNRQDRDRVTTRETSTGKADEPQAAPSAKPKPVSKTKDAGTPARKTTTKEKKIPAGDAATTQETAVAAENASQTVTIRIAVPHPKPGVSDAYDRYAAAMGRGIALKTVLKEAIADLADLQTLNAAQNVDYFIDDKSDILRTMRTLNHALVEQVTGDLDPYRLLSEYALGLRIGQLIVANYINSRSGTK